MSTEAEDQRQRAKRSLASDDGEDDAIESPGVTPVTRLESPGVTPAEEKAPDDTPVDEEETVPPIPLAGALPVTQYEINSDDEDASEAVGNFQQIPAEHLSNNTPSKTAVPGKVRGAHQLGC
jgi:hypothetical protein